MPYPSEHACRIKDPKDFEQDSFRRISQKTEDGKRIDLIIGKLKGESDTTVQAFRYPKDEWTAEEARDHCKAHDGILFEPAEGEENGICIPCELAKHFGGEIEQRVFPLAELRIDSNAEGKPKIRGYAAVFDKWSDDLGGFREIIRPGAFSKAVKRSDVRALWNHDPNIVLGRTKSKTLMLAEDARGLAIEIVPPDWAGSYLETIRRGDVDQMSFAFQVPKGGDKWTSSGESTTREIFEAYPLFDVSPVTYPAYPQTSVSVRSLLAAGGVDCDALAGALLRHQCGLTLTAEEGNLIRASIDTLSRYLPADNAQGSEEETPPTQGSRLAILRKRLEIAARAV